MRYAIEISYLGTNYHGWQKQPNAITVQEDLEKAMFTVLRKQISLVGSGRTDAGVHAYTQVIHFDSDIEIDIYLFRRINKLVSRDISINMVAVVDKDFHARFDAVKRAYVYKIILKKSPFYQGQTCFIHYPLDIDKMNLATKYLIGKHSFQSFSKVKTEVNTFDCTLTRAEWIQTNDLLEFHVSANRFLRGMVRALVGTLLEVGMSNKEPLWVKEVLEQKDRSVAGRNVLPDGLFLSEVEYDKELNWRKLN